MVYDYDMIQKINRHFSPNMVHTKQNGLYMFFARYLWQKAISVFEWEIPEEWSKMYFLYTLYGCGYVGIADIPGFGVVPQWCTFNGKRTIYYEPAGIIISNPAFPDSMTYERTLGVDAELIKMLPDYHGIADIINYYADLMALTAESLATNTINTKTAMVFASANKNAAETFKKMFDQIQIGNPAVFVDNQLFREDGTPNWQQFISNLKQMYITPEMLQAIADIESQFDSYVGLTNLNGMEKKERLISDEVNANNTSTYSRAELWKENIDASIKKVNKMFDINIKCDWRNKQEVENGIYQPDGIIPVQ